MKHQPNNKNNTDRVLKFYVTNGDYNLFKAEYEASGYSSVSAYLRKKIIGNGVIIPNTRKLKSKLDTIGYQYERIGNNINQVAKKVHLYNKEGRFPDDAMTRFNEIMEKYMKVTSDLTMAHRVFLRQLSK
ncbi:MAG: plasmid mobilization relaxosome protein MobC [Cyclobacteriaceae bacterium]|nr:plasmid mobilization relaxosome protein MobC [Cyclobacteriaceae bacterium]